MLAQYPPKPWCIFEFLSSNFLSARWFLTHTGLTRCTPQGVVKKNAKHRDGSTEDSKGLLLGLLYPAADFPPFDEPIGAETLLLRKALGMQFGVQLQAPPAAPLSPGATLLASAWSLLLATKGSTAGSWAASCQQRAARQGRQKVSEHLQSWGRERMPVASPKEEISLMLSIISLCLLLLFVSL